MVQIHVWLLIVKVISSGMKRSLSLLVMTGCLCDTDL